MRGEEKQKGESKVLLPLREIVSVCESKEKQERFFLAMRHTQELL